MEKVYILGGTQTDFERNWTKEGKNVIALLKEVVFDGFKSAQINPDEIEKLKKEDRVAAFVGNFMAEKYIDQGHIGALLTEVSPLFNGMPSARYEAACASSSVAIEAAMHRIMAGETDLALVIGWELMKTVDSAECGDILGRAAFYEKECKGLDYPFPKLFGRLADETIKKYNLDEKRYMDALARISVINYNNAKSNPLAQTRKWFMREEEAKMRGSEHNPLIGGRLATSDCSQVTDGAVFLALASEKYIKEHYVIGKPLIKGYGHRNAPMLFDAKMEESADKQYILPWTRQAVLDAYNRSGLNLHDMDVFETHDCFTSSEYVAISAFGITWPGKEYEAIERGVIEKTGRFPINPSGGLIGCGHPVGASGARMMLDLYKQVTRQADGYQIQGAKNGMMLNIGGSATTNYAYVVGME